MLKITCLTIALALAGCASTRQERAAAFQQELPQLVAACNGWIQVDARLDGPTIRRDGLKACDRLAAGDSLGLADPAAVRAYQRYTSSKFQGQAAADRGQRGTYAIPQPLPQVQ
jgi:hypothetical protein